jgi:hypothetical protein
MDPNVVIDGAGASALLKSSASVVGDSSDISLLVGKQTVRCVRFLLHQF